MLEESLFCTFKINIKYISVDDDLSKVITLELLIIIINIIIYLFNVDKKVFT